MRLSRVKSGLALVIAASTIAACSSGDASTSIGNFSGADLDTSIQPCTDFYDYVNAKWINSHTIPEDKSSINVFDELTDRSMETQRAIAESAAKDLSSLPVDSDRYRVGAMYKSATDESAVNALGAEPLRPLLAKVDAIATRDDLVNYLYQDGLSDQLVFHFGSGSDYEDANRQIGYAGSGGTELPSKDYYSDPQHADVLNAYRDYLTRSLKLIGEPDDAAAAQAAQALSLESRLAAATPSPQQARQPENQYRMRTVAEANAITPGFDWRKYLDALHLPQVDKFSLAETEFFSTFNNLLSSASLDEWKAFFRSHLVVENGALLSQNFRDSRFEFLKLLSGQQTQRPRWVVGVSAVNGTVGEAMGKLYVEKAFSPAAKARATELVKQVLEAMKQRLAKVEWMTPETRAKAIEKANKIQLEVGYPDKWRDYSGLILKGGYFDNTRTAGAFNLAHDLSEIGKPTDRQEWGANPQTVNAFSYFSLTRIVIPAGMLQSPFFDEKADDATNFGAIGSVIGHEITHQFDDQGSQFDLNGKHAEWWTSTDREQFTARTDKLAAQFDAYHPIPGKPDVHVNGKLTLGENIADLGGINASFDALTADIAAHPDQGDKIDGFTAQQRFFIGYARSWREKSRDADLLTQLASDPHSPGKFRVNGVVVNLPAFATAFTCPADAPLAAKPDVVVKIW